MNLQTKTKIPKGMIKELVESFSDLTTANRDTTFNTHEEYQKWLYKKFTIWFDIVSMEAIRQFKKEGHDK